MKKIILVISIAVLLVFIYFMYPNVNHNTNKISNTNNPRKLLNNELVQNIKDDNNSKKFTNNELVPGFFADTDLKHEYETLYDNCDIDTQIVFLKNIVDNGNGDVATYMILLDLIKNPNNTFFNNDQEREYIYDKYVDKGINEFPNSEMLKALKIANKYNKEFPEKIEPIKISDLTKEDKEIIEILKKTKAQDPNFIKYLKFYDYEDYVLYKDYLKK